LNKLSKIYIFSSYFHITVELRTTFLAEDFDKVEKVLVNFEMEKITRIQDEEDLRKREELCESVKRAQNNYEELLKEVEGKMGR